MDLLKRIKLASLLVVVLVAGYALYNQLFYEPPIKTPIVNNPIEVPDGIDEPDKEPEDEFKGIYVDMMPIVDESDRVRLYVDESELFQSPFLVQEWDAIQLPVYEKLDLSLDEINEKVMRLFEQLNMDTESLLCDDFNQDGLELTTCEFDDGYLEVVQDGSFYIIFHGEHLVPVASYDVQDIEMAITTSWLSSIVDVDTMDIVVEDQSYDTFGEPVYKIVMVEDIQEQGYQEKYELMFSYETQSIYGISKSADKGSIIGEYSILSKEQVETNKQAGLYYSTMVDADLLDDVSILGYALTYDTSMFSNVIMPVVHVYVTSDDPSFTNCFDVKGLVVHPLKVIAIDQKNIRAR